MSRKIQIPKGEEFIHRKLNHWVAAPINMQVLLSPSELMVLNTIRHLKSTGMVAISNSMLRIYTGLSDRTITSTLKSLETLGIIVRSSITANGTLIKVDYDTLLRVLQDMEMEPNPVGRMVIADDFRSSHSSHALNKTLIGWGTKHGFNSSKN